MEEVERSVKYGIPWFRLQLVVWCRIWNHQKNHGCVTSQSRGNSTLNRGGNVFSAYMNEFCMHDTEVLLRNTEEWDYLERAWEEACKRMHSQLFSLGDLSRVTGLSWERGRSTLAPIFLISSLKSFAFVSITQALLNIKNSRTVWLHIEFLLNSGGRR